jgi:hypothetical protein
MAKRIQKPVAVVLHNIIDDGELLEELRIQAAWEKEDELLTLMAIATNKERNMMKRAAREHKAISQLTKSTKPASQAFRIDQALSDFHTLEELQALPSLGDCGKARIKSHIKFLERNFSHTLKKEVVDNKFRFIPTI